MNASSVSLPKPPNELRSVAVLTPTIPGREKLLNQCNMSVNSQTVKAASHWIQLDSNGDGCAATMNKVAKRALDFMAPKHSARWADAPAINWLLPLADDDLLLPGCIEALLSVAHGGEADIIYAAPLVTGNDDRWWFFQAPPAIPSFGLIRSTLWEELGGYNESLEHEEDRDFWTRAIDAGAKFVRVDEPCWVYRQHAGNKSFNKVAA